MSTGSPSRATRGRWLPSAVGVALLGLVGAVVAHRVADDAVGAPPHASAAPGSGSLGTAVAVPDDATVTRSFATMAHAIDEQDGDAFTAAAGSTPWARATWRNLEALGIGAVGLRFVASRPGPTADVALATVEVDWTPGDRASAYDGTTTVPREVTFRVAVTDEGRLAVLGAGSGGDRWVPVWLLGTLDVTNLPGGAAIAVGNADSTVGVDVDLLTRRAVAAVDTVLVDLPDGRRRQVVVVAPATARQAAQLLGRSRSDVAAVTSTVDGSRHVGAPVQVVLNPVVFDRLGPRGAQVVVSHEATHAATGAAAVRMPLWVAEGFADWVALHDGSVPLDVAAGAFLTAVRQHGPPRSLPSESDFDAQAHGLGTTYEAAWTIFRLLGERFGDEPVIAFYETVLTGAPVQAALEDATGLDVAGLAMAWRHDVRRLARA